MPNVKATLTASKVTRRMGTRSRASLACGLGFAAVFVAGCGSSQGLLSSRDHDQLSANLLAVRQAVDKGSCPDTSDALAELATTLDGLPSGTNAKLARNLAQGAKVVRRNALRQCHHKPVKPPTTTTTQSTTTAASSTRPTTAQTTTTTTTTQQPPTTQSTTAPPPTTATTPPTPTSPPTTTTSGNEGNGGTGGNGASGLPGQGQQ